MQVSVDSESCIASGQCVWAVPEVFDQNEEDSTVVLLDPTPPGDLGDKVREAEMVCPAKAIHVEKGS